MGLRISSVNYLQGKCSDMESNLGLAPDRGSASWRPRRMLHHVDQRHKVVYCILENVVILAVIFLIWFTYNPMRENFIHINLHPLLILVALMSLKYGNYLGVLSASMASLVFLYAYHLLGRDLIIFFTEWSHYKFILMFFLTAVVLGSFKDRKDLTITDLRAELLRAEAEIEQLTEFDKKSRVINEQLHKQIVGAEDSLLSLHEVANALESVEPEVIYTEMMTVLARFLEARTVSIYSVDNENGYVRLKLRMGGAGVMASSLKIAEHPYLQQVINEQCIARQSAESHASEPVFSAPIIKDSKTVAVINVEEAGLWAVTEYYYNLFRVIVGWCNKALVRAMEYERVACKQCYYTESRIMQMGQFEKRVEEEEKRRSKFGLDYSLITLKNVRHSLPALNEAVNDLLRTVDVAAYDPRQSELHILLPVTARDFAAKVEARLYAKLGPIAEV